MTSTRTRWVGAAGSAALAGGLLLAGGCTDAPAVAPPALQPTPPPAAHASTGGAAAAPRVRDPRDPARLAGCHPSTELLGPGLVEVSTAGPTAGAAGAGCSWTGPGRAYVLRADALPGGGLDATYRARDVLRAFRPGELDGFPTVVTTPEGDPSCSLHVATSDRDALLVQVGPANAAVPDPCALASRAASRLLAALPTR